MDGPPAPPPPTPPFPPFPPFPLEHPGFDPLAPVPPEVPAAPLPPGWDTPPFPPLPPLFAVRITSVRVSPDFEGHDGDAGAPALTTGPAEPATSTGSTARTRSTSGSGRGAGTRGRGRGAAAATPTLTVTADASLPTTGRNPTIGGELALSLRARSVQTGLAGDPIRSVRTREEDTLARSAEARRLWDRGRLSFRAIPAGGTAAGSALAPDAGRGGASDTRCRSAGRIATARRVTAVAGVSAGCRGRCPNGVLARAPLASCDR